MQRATGTAIAMSLLFGATSSLGQGVAVQPATSYDAPAGCPAAAEFDRELAARLSNAGPDAWRDFVFSLEVIPVVGGYAATLNVTEPTGREIRREVEDVNCREVVRAAAFVAAVLVDPGASAAPDETAPPPSPTQASSEPPTEPTADDSPPPRQPPRKSVSLGLTLQSGVADRATFGPRMGVGIETGARFALAARFSMASTYSGEIPGQVGTARLHWYTARVEACAGWRVQGLVTFWGCPLMEVGELGGEGRGADENHVRSVLWAAPGGQVLVRLRLGPQLETYLGAGAAAPLVRPRFFFTSAAGEELVHQVPEVTLTAGMGLAVHFP